MIAFLVKLFGAGLAEQLRQAYAARLDAATEADRLAAEAQIRALEIAAANRLASPENPGIRWAIGIVALALCTHVAAVVVASILPSLGWRVHALPAPMNDWQGSIILSLFGLSALRQMLR
ncbi:hypothetical protein Q9295_14770 [Xinfangfangia sp. CPCC 101601]|uniref:Holin of 3TMs, for gene-transfer release n=1 Tax=Pseudogemmobacter lacusdianii TaxID=3069608 RepID=A0ABU0W0W2_9RHOB|nr:hypothetical protein [Xinfangfangia sp. CPCC 101601]MDQ2067638.1 hypothetical protein [Xinfangfangia sp. CPCC 101601]